MGYACPVCEAPQSDAEHLANHLAFTAMLGDDDHESWLDERIEGWADLGPEELAPELTEYAEEEEYPQVFEDTTDQGDGHGHDHGQGQGSDHRSGHDHGHGSGVGGRGPGGDDLGDPDAYDTETDPEGVLEEARELTRRRHADSEGDADDEGDESDDSGTDQTDSADEE
jgi:hypothetical protein